MRRVQPRQRLHPAGRHGGRRGRALLRARRALLGARAQVHALRPAVSERASFWASFFEADEAAAGARFELGGAEASELAV